jgi:molybdate transport system substrate-binding protein
MRPLRLLAAVACTATAYVPIRAQADQEIIVSAASSLTEAMNDIGREFSRANPGVTVRFNFAASGALQQQILQGAPVDVFASASGKEMDALETKGRILPGTRVDFASNRLVLIAPARGKLKTWDDLKTTAVSRIAISNPDSVPSGRYARETLTKRGLWPAVSSKLVMGENVRQTLSYVANGDADAGLVFATDARIEGRRVRVVATAAPGRDHAIISYPAAVVKGTANPSAARRFVQFLTGQTAKSMLLRRGFTLPERKPMPAAALHQQF